MRPTLFRSFLVIVLFWSFVAWITFGFADPDVNLRVLARLAVLTPFFHWQLPDHVTVLDAAEMQWQVFKYWTVPVLEGTAAFFVIGVVIALARVWYLSYERDERAKPKGEWRGITITRGALPEPDYPVLAKEVHIDWPTIDAEQIELLVPSERALFNDILHYLAQNPNAYPGAGHGVSLLDHTLHVISRVAACAPSDPLALVAAAAHDIGKVTSWRWDPDAETWIRTKLHDRESARLMALMPSYWGLASDRRRALTMAVKYEHAGNYRPRLTPEIDNLAGLLIDAVHAGDMQATSAEKEVVIQKVEEAGDLPSVLMAAFLRALPKLVFSTYNLPKGTTAAGWRKDGKLYFIDYLLRDAIKQELSPDLAAAFGGSSRNNPNSMKMLAILMQLWDEKGWLLTEVGEAKIPATAAFWDIRSGTKEFKHILILTPSAEVLDRAPQANSAYKIDIVAPSERLATDVPLKPDDLQAAGLLRPATDGGKQIRKARPKVAPQVRQDMPILTPAGAPAAAVATPPMSIPEPEARPPVTAPIAPQPAVVVSQRGVFDREYSTADYALSSLARGDSEQPVLGAEPAALIPTVQQQEPNKLDGVLAGEQVAELPVAKKQALPPGKADTHADLSVDDLAALASGPARRRRPSAGGSPVATGASTLTPLASAIPQAQANTSGPRRRRAF